MMALEGLPEELLNKTLCPHCYRVTEQGIIMVKISIINELRMYDLPKYSKSTASFISGLLNFVNDLIDKKKCVDQVPVIQKSVIEKPADTPRKSVTPQIYSKPGGYQKRNKNTSIKIKQKFDKVSL